MTALANIFDFTNMYNGNYEVVSITGNKVVLKPSITPNAVYYPEYINGAEIKSLDDIGNLEITDLSSRIKVIPINSKFTDAGLKVEIEISGAKVDISDKVKRLGYVDTDREGAYYLTYTLNFLNIEMSYKKLIVVSRINWLQSIVPQVFSEDSEVTKAIIKRLETIYWDISNNLDQISYKLSSTLISCDSFSDSTNIAGNVYAILDNEGSFFTIEMAVGDLFTMATQEYRIKRDLLAPEYEHQSSYLKGRAVSYGGKEYLARTNIAVDEEPGVSANWLEGYVYSSTADNLTEADGSTFYRSKFRCEKGGYIFEFSPVESVISRLVGIQENNHDALIPPKVAGLWSKELEPLTLEGDMVLYVNPSNVDITWYLLRTSASYEEQAYTPVSSSNLLWEESKFWKVCEEYNGVNTLIKRVGNLKIQDVENYALSLGIPQGIFNSVKTNVSNSIAIVSVIQFIVKYRHTIQGLNSLVSATGFNLTDMKKSDPEEDITNGVASVPLIADQMSILQRIKKAQIRGLYDSSLDPIVTPSVSTRLAYREGEVVFAEESGISKIKQFTASNTWNTIWTFESKLNPNLALNNSHYEASVSSEDYALAGCNTVYRGVTYISDEQLQNDVTEFLGLLVDYEIPTYIKFKFKLNFLTDLKLVRYGSGFAYVNLETVLGLPFYHVRFQSQEYVKLNGTVYNRTLEIIKAAISMNSVEQVLDTAVLLQMDSEGKCVFDLACQLPLGYSFGKWLVTGRGNAHVNEVSINENTNAEISDVRVSEGDVIITALFGFSIHAWITRDNPNWNYLFDGSWELGEEPFGDSAVDTIPSTTNLLSAITSLASLMAEISNIYFLENDIEVAATFTASIADDELSFVLTIPDIETSTQVILKNSSASTILIFNSEMAFASKEDITIHIKME